MMTAPAIPPTEDPRARAARTKRDRTRRALLDAADSAFGSRGWSRTRVEDIAQSAGVSAATAYNHFPTKHALLAQVYAPIISPLLVQAQRDIAADRPVTQALEDQVRALCRLCARNRTLTAAFFAAVSEYTIKVGGLPDSADDVDPRTLVPMPERLGLLIEHGQRSGELRPYPSAQDMSGLLVDTVLARNVNRPAETRYHGRAATHCDVRHTVPELAAGAERPFRAPITSERPGMHWGEPSGRIAKRSLNCAGRCNASSSSGPSGRSTRAQRSAVSTSARASTARSSSASVITSGGDKRIVEPWVSLASTPARASASLTARPVPSRGSTSTPAHSPTPPDGDARRARRGASSRAVQVRAEDAGRRQQVAVVEEADHRLSDGAGQRVAAERAAVLARPQDTEDVGVRDDGRERQRSRRRAPCPSR